MSYTKSQLQHQKELEVARERILRYQLGLCPDPLPEDCGALTGKDGRIKDSEILPASADRNRGKKTRRLLRTESVCARHYGTN